MDLGAYLQIGDLQGYVEKHYGTPPRLRGIRLMALESPDNFNSTGVQKELWDRYAGTDTIYIHTRCGAYGDEDNEDSNYVYFGCRGWEQSNPDTFLGSCDDGFDPTYRDHYFKAVVDSEYQSLIQSRGQQ